MHSFTKSFTNSYWCTYIYIYMYIYLYIYIYLWHTVAVFGLFMYLSSYLSMYIYICVCVSLFLFHITYLCNFIEIQTPDFKRVCLDGAVWRSFAFEANRKRHENVTGSWKISRHSGPRHLLKEDWMVIENLHSLKLTATAPEAGSSSNPSIFRVSCC